ncbi:MAG: rod shape-determining protein MreC [Armatimonadetes bacterium]|nr:MAG: rod shape-determining protein MreC [Armatimonadota bacterium]
MEKNTNLGIVIGIVLVSFLSYINNKTPFVNSLQGFIQDVFVSPKNIIYDLGKNNEQNLSEVEKYNKELEQKLIDYENLKKDNEAFRSQFDSDLTPIKSELTGVENSTVTIDNLIPARVIGTKGRVNNPDKLIIDKGEDDGVEMGAGVVFEKNLVGKIGRISKKYSVVILPLNRDFSTVGKTLEGNAQGIVQGEDGLTLFDRVLITDQLIQGDLILTKGDVMEGGVGISPGLVVGKIIEVNKGDSNPFQEAQVKSLVDYSKLNLVFVIGKIK